jgi:hypothetical protein
VNELGDKGEKMDEIYLNITGYLSLIGAFIILAYALWQARLVTKDIIANVDKFGSDNKGKRIVANKAVFNFYLVLGAIIVIVTGALKLIGIELFVALLVAILAGLGIKLTTEITEKPDEK